MSPSRPWSITIIAWLFILAGVWAVWDTLAQWFGLHVLSLNLGVLLPLVGRGLLKLRQAARYWALAIAVLMLILLAVIVVCGVLGLAVMRLDQHVVTGRQGLMVLVAVTGSYGALLLWMTRVLTRPDIEELFKGDAT